MKKVYFILFLTSVFSFQVFAQNHKGDKFYKYFNYAEAIPYYLKTMESGNENEKAHATQRLADCYRFTNNAPEARVWYEKAVQLEHTDTVNYFYLGQALRSLGLYEEAAKSFETFNKLVPGNDKGERYYKFAVDIQKWLDLPPVAEIKNIEALNSRYSDFCPVFYRDGIVFTSDRQLNSLDKNVYGWTNFNYLNLYYTIPEYYKIFWNGVPEPQKMSNDFNQTYHDGPVCFSSDNRWVYITRATTKQGEKLKDNIKTFLLKIYFAEITGSKPPKFKPFPYNSNEYSVGHPALSQNADTLIFSSDMPGGYGGSDLYMCVMESGKWGEPINLGEKINSIGNEVFPYWKNGMLFFSSDNHLGYGGLDIFQSKLTDGKWSEPENLKAPINSSYDDFGIGFKDDLTEGLFSSNRPEGKGNDDIYGFKMLSLSSVAIKESPMLTVSGKVTDQNNLPLRGATVFLLDPGKNTVQVLITDEEGMYTTEVLYNHTYISKAMKDVYVHDCTLFETPVGEIESYQVPRDLRLVKLEINQMFKVENIYYDLDKWYIRKDAEPALDKLVQIMKEYPITAELSSHTDSRGPEEYNLELSQKRAESAVRYIVLQGVAPSRITAKGYGETKLVNKCADGIECTEEEHQANRRTEFKITSVGNSLTGEGIDLSRYKNGDIISAATLGGQFFENCIK